MSSNIENEEHDPVANLSMQPAKSILKSKKSIDDIRPDLVHETIVQSTDPYPTSGMTRSESKSHKIPHFDEMNIIATYHPVDKDYGHMKIEEPKTPYAPNDMIDEEMPTESCIAGVDPDTLAQRLNQSTVPLVKSQFSCERRGSTPTDDEMDLTPEALEHRRKFESHRKKHYNEFEVVRLRKKEIEEELRALDQEDPRETQNKVSKLSEDNGLRNENERSSHASVDSIKPILVHHAMESSTSSDHYHPHPHHHVHVEADSEEDQNLTPEERERKRQFEMKRKKHYNEFRVAHMADKLDDEPDTTG